jgi:hypothetical protein
MRNIKGTSDEERFRGIFKQEMYPINIPIRRLIDKYDLRSRDDYIITKTENDVAFIAMHKSNQLLKEMIDAGDVSMIYESECIDYFLAELEDNYFINH